MNELPGTPPDFSLVLGGPLYQLWRGTRLTDDVLHLLHRRLLATVALAWLPLLLLSIARGTCLGRPRHACRSFMTWSCTSGC